MKDFAADKAKRRTLKRIGALAATAGLANLASPAMAGMAGHGTPALEVHTRVSAASNELEVVITNVGDADADIRQLTPSETTTRRGRFDFTAATHADGHLYLAAGESVTVPMQRRRVVLDGSELTGRAHSLADTLKRSMSAELRNGQLAPLTVRGFAPLA